MDTLQVALDRFKQSPTEIHRITLDTMLDAYNCAYNHSHEPDPFCVFCQEEALIEIPTLLQEQQK